MIDNSAQRCVELSIPEAIPETALRANKHVGKAAGGGLCRLRNETGGDGPDASARGNRADRRRETGRDYKPRRANRRSVREFAAVHNEQLKCGRIAAIDWGNSHYRASASINASTAVRLRAPKCRDANNRRSSISSRANSTGMRSPGSWAASSFNRQQRGQSKYLFESRTSDRCGID